MTERVVLPHCGGLDTPVAIPYLAEQAGGVPMTVHGGRAVVTGRPSGGGLYAFGMATYDTGDTFDQSLAKGSGQPWGPPSRTASARNDRLDG